MLFGIALMIGVGVFKLGLIPVNADVPPSGLETRFIPMAVHASVAHHAEEQPNPVAPTDENLIAGGEIYTELCARCHGIPGRGPSVLGASFYPPAPQFTLQPSGYNDGELFWIIKHGIRNTGCLPGEDCSRTRISGRLWLCCADSIRFRRRWRLH